MKLRENFSYDLFVNLASPTSPCHSVHRPTPVTMPKQSDSHCWSWRHEFTTVHTHSWRDIARINSQVATSNRFLVLGVGIMMWSTDICGASSSYPQIPDWPEWILECTLRAAVNVGIGKNWRGLLLLLAIMKWAHGLYIFLIFINRWRTRLRTAVRLYLKGKWVKGNRLPFFVFPALCVRLWRDTMLQARQAESHQSEDEDEGSWKP